MAKSKLTANTKEAKTKRVYSDTEQEGRDCRNVEQEEEKGGEVEVK